MPKQERFVEFAGRAGLLSRAAIWLVTGALAARLALEGQPEPGAEPDKQGALQTLARQPLGRGLLIALAVGFVAMIVWSVGEAVRSDDGERTNHLRRRAVAAGRAVLYAGLAWSTVQLTLTHHSNGGDGQEKWTARVLGWPGGRWLVGAIGLTLLGVAAYNVWRGLSGHFEKHWDRQRMDERARRIAKPVEAIGYVGHAMVYALVGWFLSMAALHFDPSEPKSLDESLFALIGEQHGRIICLVVAAGMVAWALNATAQSRWRKIPSTDS